MQQERHLCLGLLHLAPVVGDVEGNRRLVEIATVCAAEAGADWAISGELVVPGYEFEAIIGTSWIHPQPDAWVASYARLCATFGMASFLSHPERDPESDLLFNSMFVIDRDGQIIGRHRKLHPTPGSEAWSSAGAPVPPVRLDEINVGLLVCADAYPPTPARDLYDGGAEILVSAAAWWPGEWGPAGEWEARSAETGLPFIVCNRTGQEPTASLLNAASVVIDRGERIATLQAESSTVFVLDLALSGGHITACRIREHVL